MTAPTPYWLRPSIFEPFPGIVTGFSTRREGYSKPPFDSLNLGLTTGDREEDVLRNRKLLFQSTGLSEERLSTGGQVHGTKIKTLLEPETCAGYDGLVTAATDNILGILVADCAAVLMADPQNGVIGACHSGWRGTVGRISEETVADMSRLGARPEQIRAYISPCISVEKFEVGPEVAEQFDARYVRWYPGKERPHVDIKAAIFDQLIRAGVLPEAIEVSPHCTFSQTDQFFSHRAEKGRTGRMLGFIAMRAR